MHLERTLIESLPSWFEYGRPFTIDDVYARLLQDGQTSVDPIELFRALETLALQGVLERRHYPAHGGRPCTNAYLLKPIF